MCKAKEDQYTSWIQAWKKRLEDFVEECYSNKERPVIVAMSRKAPRLLFWMRMSESENEKTHIKDCLDKAELITEHSIVPYFTYLKKDKHVDFKVLIIDDALYFGATIDSIAASIYWLTGNKPYVLPLARNVACRTLQYGNLIETGNIFHEDMRPYLTTTNMEHIKSTGYPLDMEFPILRIKANGKLNLDDVKKAIECEYEGNTIYSITHNIQNEDESIDSFNNCTVLFDANANRRYAESDFSKMRCYIVNDELIIEIYSPRTIPEDWLIGDERLFINDELDRIWHNLKNRYYENNMEEPYVKDENLHNKIKKEYRHIYCQSLATIANYLYSFATMMANRKQINTFSSVIGETSAKIDSSDLNLLFGPEISNLLVRELNSLYNNSEKVFEPEVVNLLYSFTEKEIPQNIESYFNKCNIDAWSIAKNLDEALTSLFTHLHFHIGLASFTDNLSLYEKMSFGVSYASMEKDLSVFFVNKNMQYAIHKWVDSKIDEGTVAPKYVRIQRDGRFYWKRLFRSGENECTLIKIVRIALYIHQTAQKKCFKKHISVEVYKELLCYIFEKSESWGMPRYLFENTNTLKSNDIYDYLLRYNYIVTLEIGSLTYCEIGTNALCCDLMEANSLSSYLEQKINMSVEKAFAI